MARLIRLSDTSWKQPLVNRLRDFRLFNVHRAVAKFCNIVDYQRRMMSVEFENGDVLEQKIFTITSGVEMRMSSESQKKIEEYKQRMPASYYTVRVLDVENPAAPDEICFDVDSEYMEGGKYSVRHFNLERNPKAARDKKRQYKNLHGFLACEVCGFNFGDKYLEADDFIECHHLMPLNKLERKTAIRLEDLALLCSNCHRVAHIHLRKHDGRLSVSELKNAILRSDL